jgi:phage RecT family recombinase
MAKTDIATRDETAVEKGGIVEYLETISPKLEEAATRHLSPDRLIRVFLGIAARNPKIHQCSRASIVNALSQCSSTGLEPGGALKLVDLIPYWNSDNGCYELQFQPRYGGFAELARRSGEVSRMNASPVYKWEMEQGLFEYSHEPPTIRHDMDPAAPELKDKDIIGGYAVAELINGQRVQIWLSLQQIDKRRMKSGKPNSHFWKDWYPEMVRKTLLRALLDGGLVPRSTELALAMQHDADNFAPYEQTTKAQRRVGLFKVKVPATGKVIEAEAREVETNWHQKAAAVSGEMGLTDEGWANAVQDAETATLSPDDWTEADYTRTVEAMERGRE